MAQVYAATHRNGRRAAVKVLRPELAVEPVFVERFLREGYLVNKIQHPGAVAILDDDTTPDGAPFLVLELLLGRTLRERVTTTGPLDVDDALHIGVEVLDVLAAAHDHGIVHRDLKPENLFETTEGTIKVLDFGIARLRERAHGGLETLTGTTMGTVGYMPPEQARGQSTEIDARSDLWAVGATLYTLLTGRVLHEAPGTNEGLLEAMTTPVPPMRELAPSLPPLGLQPVLLTAGP
jgi:eukaryotic-like serine/threonine-protein kinase